MTYLSDMDFEHTPSDRERDEQQARDDEKFYYVRGRKGWPILEWESREIDHGMEFK